MAALTIRMKIEELHVNGGIELTISCTSEQEGNISPSTLRLGKTLNEQMRLAVITAKTTMNERT